MWKKKQDLQKILSAENLKAVDDALQWVSTHQSQLKAYNQYQVEIVLNAKKSY